MNCLKLSLRFLAFLSLMIAQVGSHGVALAHGEDVPGPHGGDVRMPGAFHTEVKSEDGSLQIYLLDMNFSKPTIENSQLEALIKSGKTEVKLQCSPRTTSFSCALPKSQKLDSGELIIKANRDGLKGNAAVYQLPLKFGSQQPQKKIEKKSPSGHEGHHGHHH
jgi:hypothetical protein